MLTGRFKTCMGVLLGSALALIYALPCSADGSSDLSDMQKELRALKAEVESLRSDLSSGREEMKVQNEELLASKREFGQLSEQVRGLRQANPEDVETLKDQIKKELGVVPNVYNNVARKIRVGMNARTRAEYSNNFHRPLSHQRDVLGGQNPGGSRAGGVSEDETIVLSRIRLNIDADINEHARAFFQLQDSRFWGISGTTVALQGTTNGENPTDPDNTLDMHQGYVDVKKLFNWPLTVRVGRQEIIWGAKGPGAFGHRMMGSFGWSNVARSWEGIRAMWDTENYAVEAFGAVQRHTQRNNNGANTGEQLDEDRLNFGGMWTFKKLVPNATLQLMYLMDDDMRNFAGGGSETNQTGETGELEVHDVGFRIVGKVGKPWDYFAEYHEQFGEWRGDTHRARAGVIGGGYTFVNVGWKPRLGVEFNWSPGDGNGAGHNGGAGSGDGEHRTFHNFYPTNHAQYGYIDMMSWKNMKGLRGQIKIKPTKKLVAWADVWSFWLDNVNDNWYNAAGIAQRGFTAATISSTEPDSHLGIELDLTAKYKLYKNVALQAGYSRFFSGDYLDDTANGVDAATQGGSRSGADADTDWAYLQMTVGF